MKRQFAFLIAMSFMVSGLASFAEETAQDTAAAQAQIVETVETQRDIPFEDGGWMSVPEWNAEVYLPAGWTLTEVTENGFVASDAEGASAMTAVIGAFEEAQIQTGEAQAESAQTDVELTAFESYLMGLGEEYELALAGEREMAFFETEDGMNVMFVVNDQLVTLTFAYADGDSLADSALSIAETFYVYAVEEEPESIEEAPESIEEAPESIDEEAAAE